MSSSEKLRALHERPNTDDKLAAALRMLDALPQIVAVIESAEDAADAFIDQSAHDRGWPIELKAALKELNDALS